MDSRTLGRPVHLLSAFAGKFGADLADLLRQGVNRRYGTCFAVGDVILEQAVPAVAQRWNVYASTTGRIGVALDRSLVLRVLSCRYGLAQGLPEGSALEPVTATEERLARMLGEHLVQALALRIRRGLPVLGGDPDAGAPETLAWRADSAEAVGAWTLKARIEEPGSDRCSEVLFSLDEAWMGLLLRTLAAGRLVPQKNQSKDDTQPLAQRLQVKLVAQLLHRRMALGQILDIKVGDIIPVSFQTANVLVKDSCLFTATVAEHKGGLWLTAFNDTP